MIDKKKRLMKINRIISDKRNLALITFLMDVAFLL